MAYYDRALKWWSGSAWQPKNSDWVLGNLTKEAATSTATSMALTASATTINNGQTTTLTATLSPSAATGSVVFKGNGFTSSAVTVSGGKATYVAAPTSTGTVTATFTGTGIYLGCSKTISITVRQKSVKKASHTTRNSWQWGMSGAPHKITSSFGVNSGTNDIPYSSAVITGVRIQVAGYYGRSDALNISQAGIYNNSDAALVVASNPAVARAGSSDTPLSPTFNVPDYTVSTGTYRIGFVFPNTMSCQWDEHTGASGYTTYEDGAARGSQSLLWEIDYYIWV